MAQPLVHTEVSFYHCGGKFLPFVANGTLLVAFRWLTRSSGDLAVRSGRATSLRIQPALKREHSPNLQLLPRIAAKKRSP
jgi:hypothetical protein